MNIVQGQDRTVQNTVHKVTNAIQYNTIYNNVLNNTVSIGILGLVDEASCSREETVFVPRGFGPDGPQSPAGGDWFRAFVSRVRVVSHNLFLDQILEGLDGVVSIADDMAVYGASEEEHDRNLINLMERATKTGIVFNSEKCTIKQTSISFFGNLYTDKGIKPDPAKIRDIQKMPTPQNKDELSRFLGLLTYLSPYIPKFADKAHTLRALLKSDMPWTWDSDHQKSFEDLKSIITKHECLKYYDPSTPLTLEVDASLKGLGVALVRTTDP